MGSNTVYPSAGTSRLSELVEDSGLRSFLAQRLVDQIEAVELVPLAAELLTTFTHDGHHQRLLDEVLLAFNRLMTDPVALLTRFVRRSAPSFRRCSISIA